MWPQSHTGRCLLLGVKSINSLIQRHSVSSVHSGYFTCYYSCWSLKKSNFYGMWRKIFLSLHCCHGYFWWHLQMKEMPLSSPERPWRVDPAEAAKRRDLRDSHLVFSIDPVGCEDVDDTLSVRSLADGTLLELGVHIADVTHFVAEGSLTDLEARTRWAVRSRRSPRASMWP